MALLEPYMPDSRKLRDLVAIRITTVTAQASEMLSDTGYQWMESDEDPS